MLRRCDFKEYFSHDMSNIFFLLTSHCNVFIVHVYSYLPLVILFDPEVFVMKPENEANRKHVRNRVVDHISQLKKCRVILSEVNKLRKIDSKQYIHHAS